MDMLNDRIVDAGIDVRFIADRVGETRGTNTKGQKFARSPAPWPRAPGFEV